MGCGCGKAKAPAVEYHYTTEKGTTSVHQSRLQARAEQLRSGGGGRIAAVTKK